MGWATRGHGAFHAALVSISDATPLLVDILQKSLRSQRYYYQNGKPIKTLFREYQTSKAEVFSKVIQTLTESIGALQQAHKVVKHEVTVLAVYNSSCKRQWSAAVNSVSKSRCRYDEKTASLLHLIELRHIAHSRAAQGIIEMNLTPTYVTDARLKEELMAHLSLEEQLDFCLQEATQLSGRSDESLLQLLDTSSQVLESACLSPMVAAIEASIRAMLSSVRELTALAVTTLAGISVHDEGDLQEGLPLEAISVEEWLTYLDRLLGPFSSTRKRLGTLVETMAPAPRRFSTSKNVFSSSSRTLNDLCAHSGAAAQLYETFLRRFHEKTQLSLCQQPLAEAAADARKLLALRDSLKSRKESRRPRKSEYCSLSSMDSLNLLDEVSVTTKACLERHKIRNSFISSYLRTTTASLLQVEATTSDKLKQLLTASTEPSVSQIMDEILLSFSESMDLSKSSHAKSDLRPRERGDSTIARAREELLTVESDKPRVPDVSDRRPSTIAIMADDSIWDAIRSTGCDEDSSCGFDELVRKVKRAKLGRLLDETVETESEWIERFRLGGRLLASFSCAIKHKILLQGRLYVSNQHLSFYSSFNSSNLFGRFPTVVVLPLDSIKTITPTNTAQIFPTAIDIQLQDRTVHHFTSFASRNLVVDFLRCVAEPNSGVPQSDVEVPITSTPLACQAWAVPPLSGGPTEPLKYTYPVAFWRVPFEQVVDFLCHDSGTSCVMYQTMEAEGCSDFTVPEWSPPLPAGSQLHSKADCPTRRMVYRKQVTQTSLTRLLKIPEVCDVDETQTIYEYPDKVILEAHVQTSGIPFAENFFCIMRYVVTRVRSSEVQLDTQLHVQWKTGTFFASKIESECLVSFRKSVDTLVSIITELVDPHRGSVRVASGSFHPPSVPPPRRPMPLKVLDTLSDFFFEVLFNDTVRLWVVRNAGFSAFLVLGVLVWVLHKRGLFGEIATLVAKLQTEPAVSPLERRIAHLEAVVEDLVVLLKKSA